MLRDKITKKIEEIKTDFNPERFCEEKIASIFKALKITESLKEFNSLKQNGYSAKTVLPDEPDKPHCLIFDDTTVQKSGKKMENPDRVWDHVTKRSVLGFKILVMLYRDDKSFIPVDCSIHREKGKNESKPYGVSKKELHRS